MSLLLESDISWSEPNSGDLLLNGELHNEPLGFVHQLALHICIIIGCTSLYVKCAIAIFVNMRTRSSNCIDATILKEGNVLFNDALKTFYLRLYGVRHMVKDHSDSEKGNPLPPRTEQ